MAKDNNKEKQQKPQSYQKKITINETHKKSVDAGDSKGSRRGTASDTTGSTGPRKK